MTPITGSDHEPGDLESLVYGPLDETNSIIQDIMSRRQADEIPEVLPEHASTDSIENVDIIGLLEWLQRTDHAKMKKYMDDRYHDYLNGDGQLQGSSAKAHAKWARDWFYVHASKYFEFQKSICSKTAEAFVSMVRLDYLPEEAIDATRDLLKQIGDARAEELVKFMKSEWIQFWESLASFLRVDEVVMQQKWAASRAEELLRRFIASIDIFEFQPELSLDFVEPGAQRDAAAALVARVTKEHVDTIQSEVDRAFITETKNIPCKLLENMRDEIRQKFLEAKYFDIVGSVLDNLLDAHISNKFTPAISVDVLPEDAKSKALSLILRVMPEHYATIDEEVEARFADIISKLPDFLQNHPQDSIREQWMKENYFDIVEEIIDRKTVNLNAVQKNASSLNSAASSVAEASTPRRRTALTAMLESPHQRNTRMKRDDHRGDAKEPLYVTVAGIVGSSSRSDAHILQAYVLYWPEEPRWVETKDRRTQASEQVAVVTCVVADREGPVLVDFWRESALTAIASFDKWMAGVDSSKAHDPLMIELKYFWIRAEGRKTLVPMRKVVSSERTEIRILAVGTQESVTRMMEMPPAEMLFTRDLSKLECDPPFVVSVVGVIRSCGEESMSRAGRAMKFFELHDYAGNCVQCTAVGRHAENTCIEDGNEVVLYFAQGTASSAVNPCGQLWLYDESHILLLRRECIVPPTRCNLEFKTRS